MIKIEESEVIMVNMGARGNVAMFDRDGTRCEVEGNAEIVKNKPQAKKVGGKVNG